MRLLIQQVKSATLDIEKGKKHSEIWRWIIIYLWIHNDDLDCYKDKISKIIKKLPNLKCLTWDSWEINTSLNDLWGEILLVSNFTLYWRNLKWVKLDFVHSAPYKQAEQIYQYFVHEIEKAWWKIKTGEFWADMIVESINDGPINYILDY